MECFLHIFFFFKHPHSSMLIQEKESSLSKAGTFPHHIDAFLSTFCEPFRLKLFLQQTQLLMNILCKFLIAHLAHNICIREFSSIVKTVWQCGHLISFHRTPPFFISISFYHNIELRQTKVDHYHIWYDLFCMCKTSANHLHGELQFLLFLSNKGFDFVPHFVMSHKPHALRHYERLINQVLLAYCISHRKAANASLLALSSELTKYISFPLTLHALR